MRPASRPSPPRRTRIFPSSKRETCSGGPSKKSRGNGRHFSVFKANSAFLSSGASFCILAECFQDLFRMALRFHLGKNLQQSLVRANQKCGALNAADLLAIHVLVAHHIELVAHLFIDIGEERVRQVVLLLKFFLRFRSVARNAKYHRARFLQLCKRVAKATSFNGAAWSIRARIKK